MQQLTPFDQAHLLVAAIRVIQWRNKGVAPVSDVQALLAIGEEEMLHFIRKFEDAGILQTVEKPGGMTLFVADHLRIESLEKSSGKDRLESEVEAFQNRQKSRSSEIEAFRKKQKAKQQALFDRLDRELKERNGKKS